jgi:hypothetical protein
MAARLRRQSAFRKEALAEKALSVLNSSQLRTATPAFPLSLRILDRVELRPAMTGKLVNPAQTVMQVLRAPLRRRSDFSRQLAIPLPLEATGAQASPARVVAVAARVTARRAASVPVAALVAWAVVVVIKGRAGPVAAPRSLF